MRVKNLFRLLSWRFIMTALLIALQIVWIALMFFRAISYVAWTATVLQVLGVLVAMYIVKKNDIAAYRMGWILIILITPVFGGLLYLLLGNKRPASRLRRRLNRGSLIHDLLLERNPETEGELQDLDRRSFGTFNYVSAFGKFPLWKNTRVKYHRLGEEQFADMLEELKRARHFIFLEYFIIDNGEMWSSILDILTDKVKEGLDVRLIYDDMGCLSKIPSKYNVEMEKLGIKCIAFNRVVPFISAVMNHRDHRKIMVIDGETAFTGGINLADEYINRKMLFGHWKDTGLMLKGDAVRSFTAMFLEMWNSFRHTDSDFSRFLPETEKLDSDEGFVQPFCDSPLDRETVSANVYLDLLSQARDYVYISTPYLAISDELQLALCIAAKRGVDVRLALPGIPDKKLSFRLTRSYYGPLLESGVKIYEYTPGFLHGKNFVSDDKLAVVGSINLDYRSLYLHFECGVLMYGCPAIEQIKDDAIKTFEVSHRVLPRDGDRGAALNFLGAMLDAVLRVFAILL